MTEEWQTCRHCGEAVVDNGHGLTATPKEGGYVCPVTEPWRYPGNPHEAKEAKK